MLLMLALHFASQMKSLYVLHRVLREVPSSSDKALKRHMMKVTQYHAAVLLELNKH
jgi:hypothetical protein